MVGLRKNNPGVQFLIELWSKYCNLEDFHLDWARTHVKILPGLKRGHSLYFQGEQKKEIYIVYVGTIGRVIEGGDGGKRKILNIGTPGMALMTTDHLYSSSPSKGDIISLNSGTGIIRVSYRSILELRELDRNADVLINVLTNRKKKHLSALRRISLERSPQNRCILFAKELPELNRMLSQQDIADLLGVSRRTVQKVSAQSARNWPKG